MSKLLSSEPKKELCKETKKSGINIEVARVSGALRCGIGFDCRRDVLQIPEIIDNNKIPKYTLSEFLDDTIAHARSTQAKLLKEILEEQK